MPATRTGQLHCRPERHQTAESARQEEFIRDPVCPFIGLRLTSREGKRASPGNSGEFLSDLGCGLERSIHSWLSRPMPTLSPQTLTRTEQAALLAVTAAHPRDHLVFSIALGTGLRLAEIVGLDVGDVYSAAGQPKSRVRIRAEKAREVAPATASCQTTSRPLHWRKPVSRRFGLRVLSTRRAR